MYNSKNSLDWWSILWALFLCIIGVVLVYSATYNEAQNWANSMWFKQVLFFIVGYIIFIGMTFFPIGFYKKIAWPTYFLSLIFLIIVAAGFGASKYGAGRWISIGGFNFQPSEFSKIAYILALSTLLENRKITLKKLSTFTRPLIVFIVPFLLILKQPDLSTALVFLCLTAIHFYWSGMSLWELFLLASPALSMALSFHNLLWGGLIIVVLIALWKVHLRLGIAISIFIGNLAAGFSSFYLWNEILKPHQRSRILTFLDPLRDPRGEGYQVIQSKVAIGSGGLSGKGFLEGSQTNLSFLPEEHTDFIFSVLGEQFGLIGCIVIIVLFFLLLFRILHICTMQKNIFGNYLLVGVAAIFAFHIFVNIAMTLGIMPVTGLPLPLLSYGGSFVITCMVLLGFVQVVYKSGSET
jgi:rod shape determining protein RodA